MHQGDDMECVEIVKVLSLLCFLIGKNDWCDFFFFFFERELYFNILINIVPVAICKVSFIVA